MIRKLLLTTLALSSTAFGMDHHTKATMFTVRIENVSKGNVLQLSSGSSAPFAVSPGLWVVHTTNGLIFNGGDRDRGQGLETQAEDGDPGQLAESLKGKPGIMTLGVFNTPVGAVKPDAIGPGGAYEFSFSATPGSRLTITEMFGQSNDLFYAPGESGISLFDGKGQPIRGDVTRELILWDAGTEMNQEPGAGPDQAPRQKAPNTGPAEMAPIHPVKDGFVYPRTMDVLRVTITPK